MSATHDRLDEKGRCCGRKPIAYKRPYVHYFCTRCDRAFNVIGYQTQNWAWKRLDDGTFQDLRIKQDDRS